MSRQVSFDIAEPSEIEYFEEYSKLNKMTVWFFLIFLLTSAVQLGFTFQLGPYEYRSVSYLHHYLVINEGSNISGVLYKPICYQSKKYYQSLGQVTKYSCTLEMLVFDLGIGKGIGICVGSIVSGILADLYGRRQICLITSALWTIIAYCLIFVASKNVLLACCIIISSFCQATQMISFINFGEIASKKTRILCIYTMAMNTMGGLFVTQASNKIGDWTKLTIFIAIVMPVINFACWYIPESPRWLMNKNKKRRAFDQLEDLTGLEYNIGDVAEEQEEEKMTQRRIFLEMFIYLYNRRLKYTVIFCMLETIATLFYTCGRLKTVIHFIYTRQLESLSFLIEAGSYLFITPVYIFLGKRFGLLFIFILLTIGSVVSLLAASSSKGVYYSVFQILFGMSSTNFLWAYALDVYPTYVRATLFGILGLVTGATTICSHILVDKLEIADPFTYYLTLLVVSMLGVLVLILPNTAKQDLPNNKLRK